MKNLLYLFLLAITPALAKTRLITHIADEGDELATIIRMENTTDESKTIELIAYEPNGAKLTSTKISLKPGMLWSQAASDILPKATTHLIINGASELSVSAVYGSAATEIQASTKTASSWLIQPNGEQQDLIVINSGAEPADIWVYQRDAKGTILKATRVINQLAPMAKHRFSLDIEQSGDSSYSIASSQRLAVTGLSYNSKGALKLSAETVEAKSDSQSTRDERNVWFIKGGTLYDALEMMGYNVATDRLWQAEVFRRTGTGRLAEIFGSDLVGQDVSVRTTGYSHAELDAYFEDSHEDTKAAITAYVDGFNRRIAEVNSDPIGLLPFEFKALGHTSVTDWSRYDVMGWVYLLQRGFSSLGDLGFGQVVQGLNLLTLVEQYGVFSGINMFADLVWRNDAQAPVMIPDAVPPEEGKRAANDDVTSLRSLLANSKKRPDMDGMRQLVEQRNAEYERNVALLKKVGGFAKGGSYAWAVAGSKTASGNPMVYSGPQMGFSAPAIVFEGSIECPALTVSGMSVPGIPALIIGRTPHHAWSMQVGHTNTWDFYVDSPEDVELHHVETVKVLGGADIQVPVYRTQHGPVVAQEPFVLSWKYSAWGKEWRLAEGNLALARAQSMDEFGEAIANLAVTQHFTYADRDGNIAYWMSGFNPIRPEGEYRVPQGFLGPALEWEDAFHPPVHDANTPQGFYAGWNNKSRSSERDWSGSYAYGQWHRAIVIQEWLRTHDNLSFEDVKGLAPYIASTNALSVGNGGNLWWPVATAFSAAVNANPSPERLAALEMMVAWDGHFIAGGEDAWITGLDVADAWYLLNSWLPKVVGKVFDDELGQEGSIWRRISMLIRELNPDSVLKNNYRKWVRNFLNDGLSQSMDEIIVGALDEALAELGELPWGIGARGTLSYGHTFGLPIPTTPWMARSTYAHLVEYGSDGPVRIESTFPLGQSGFINVDAEGTPVFDPHFFSMKELFDSFTLRDFPLFEGSGKQ